MLHFIKKINIFGECQEMRWKLWQCPPFLFVVMGLVTVVSMLATYSLASRYIEQPEVAALMVIFVTVLFLILGNLIINGFNRIAEANRMKSEFVSIVSHQLRSPLSIFKWTLDVIDRLGKSDGGFQNLADPLKTLRDTTEGMIRLVNSLLEVSRIEARTLILEQKPFSLNELTQKVVENFRNYARASQVELTFTPDFSLPGLMGDQERIGMVLENLVGNAIHYTKGAGTVSIAITKTDGRIRWAIHDQGVGISLTEQKYIFQKFFRAKDAKTRQTHGTGIGLYIAKAIIEASGGVMGFDSATEKGSTFWFTLPLQK